jgi:hypothetical protein
MCYKQPRLPVSLIGSDVSGFGAGVFLGLAATWDGEEGVLSSLTTYKQHGFGTTVFVDTWLSIPFVPSIANLKKKKKEKSYFNDLSTIK